MKSDNYVVIHGWMCNELELKGNELLIFALIHGFSQDGESRFRGSRRYIADTFNISLPTVDKALSNLADRGLIDIIKINVDNEVHNEYKVCKETLQGDKVSLQGGVKKLEGGSKETLQGGVKKLYRGDKETLLNNTSNTTNKKTRENSKEIIQTPTFEFGGTKSKKDNLFTKCVNLIDSFDFSTWGNIRNLLVDYLQFRVSIKEKPLYANMWKGMLAKLCEMCDDDIAEYEAVIKQSIEKGYLSFYPVNSYSQRLRSESGAEHVPTMTQSDYEDEEKMIAELEAKGVQVRF